MGLVMENNNNSDYERYQRARKQVDDIKGFYGHLASYVLVMLVLAYINLKYIPEYLWFFWPMLGWGIGLICHALFVFNWLPFLSKEWEERKIKAFMEEELNKNKIK